MTLCRNAIAALTLVVAVPLVSPADEPPKREAKTLGGHTGTVRVLYAPDGTLATFSDDHAVRLWDAQGRVPRHLDGHEGGVGSAAFTPDDKTLATASGESVRLWDVAEGKPRPAKGLPAGAQRLAFSPDGKTLACVVGRGEVRLWDVGTETVTRTFSGVHPKDVPSLFPRSRTRRTGRRWRSRTPTVTPARAPCGSGTRPRASSCGRPSMG